MWYNCGVSEMNYQIFRERFSSFVCFSSEQMRVAFPGFNRSNYQELIWQ